MFSKRLHFLGALSLCFLCIAVRPVVAQEPQVADMPFMNDALPVEQRVADLLQRLTPEEKIGLMMHTSAAVDRLGIPAYNWWNEALHGVARSGNATVFPQAIGMAAAFDQEEHLKTFTIISDEARAKYHHAISQGNRGIYYGITFWTPNINIFRDPRWGRGMETYGEDPYLSGRLGVAAVKGLQGDDPHYVKTHACAKHFAVHSGPEWNRHSYDAYATPRDLWETYLPVFEELVKEGHVQEVMCAYNRFEGEPCCDSDKLLIRILREKWGYQGLVVSDCWAVDDFFVKGRHEVYPNALTATTNAVLSGTDLECGNSFFALLEAYKNGSLSEEQLDVPVGRLLKARFQMGMFDPQEKVPWSRIPFETVSSAEHTAQALKMARESMTLLKNEHHVLPLSKKIKCIAVVGANAADSTMLWGNYNGFPSATVTVLDGIKAKLPQTKVIYNQGCDLVSNEENPSFDAVLQQVQEAEVIIYVGGLSPKLEGEEMPVKAKGFKGGDRETIELPLVQRRMLAALRTTGKPVIFVLCTGSALALTPDEPNYDALLNAWYGGQAGGTAVADVLFGDYNPAGRLPVTFYKSLEQLPDFQDYAMKGRTYRYMTEEPLYPFGYGLSYTSFAYRKARLSDTKVAMETPVTLTVKVTNTGSCDGDEVAQVYVKRLNDPDAPIKALKGFQRVFIPSGKTRTLTFVLEPKAFSYYDPAVDDVIEKPGTYQILYGSSSADKDLQSLTLQIIK